jgi:WD40 repeat protein
MIGSQRNGVFLSYARNDAEQFASTLRERLREQAPDIDIKQDRILLEGGVGWWEQLKKAIESVEFLILVMTPSTMQSETVRKEWRYARQQGICVYPVKAAPDSELNFPELPQWMKKAHFFDLDKEWESFIAHLRKGCDTARVPFMAPDLPENFVERPNEFGQLKNLLLSPDRKKPIAITTALSGAGGFGKTSLAIVLCHDEEIIQNFDDGILWVTLGQNPNIMGSLITLYAGLTGDRPGFASEEDAVFQLAQKLEDRACLLVLEDVWDESHLRPFLRGGKGTARLFTTRMAQIASTAHPVNVGEMRAEEAAALISHGVPGIDATRARELAARLGEWPIALELAGAIMRQRIEQGDSPENAARRLLQLLEKKGPRSLARDTGDPRRRTIDGVLAGSLELLNADDRGHLAELSAFPEDIPIPLSAAATLWGLDEFDCEDIAQRFARLNLLKLDLGRGSMRLHDVMRSWLSSAVPNAAELHIRLVDSWPDFTHLPGAYAWRWLIWHLERAGRIHEIEALLWNPAWLQAKLQATDVSAVIADFEYLKGSREAEVIQGALRLSSHILAKDPSQFPSQMIGRLLLLANQPGIQPFIDSLAQTADRPWLRPRWPRLDPPGTALLRTLAGHTGGVYCVAIAPNGLTAVSGSYDNTLKVWDVESGRELRTLEGHSSGVTSVAIFPDGRHALSASDGETLKIWDLESGREIRTLQGPPHSPVAVRSLAIAPDGRCAVATSCWDLVVWNLETGVKLHTLPGHSGLVRGVVVTADNRHALSASEDKTLKLWDLESGTEVRTLIGHSGSVNDVVLTADGHAISASSDGTLKAWDLNSGAELRTIACHSSAVEGMAMSGGHIAVSFPYRDKPLKVWDLASGTELCALVGHSDWIDDVAVTRDGRHAISASSDKTLKVWDLDKAAQLRTLADDSGPCFALAASADGRLAISGSYCDLLVWDLKTGVKLHTLAGHSKWVKAVAVTADGRYAISASDDETLKVWDLESGSEIYTLSGHSPMSGAEGVTLIKDGQRALSFDCSAIRIWDLEKKAELYKLDGHRYVIDVASADGTRAVSVSADAIKVWNLETGLELLTLARESATVRSMALTPDGRRAVFASEDRTIKVWDLESDAKPRTLSEFPHHVSCVAITTDGRRVVSSSWDDTLKVWDLESGEPITTFTCDAPAVRCAIADDRTIVVVDQRGQIHLLTLEFPPPH